MRLSRRSHDAAAMRDLCRLLLELVDTRAKLEILVHLYCHHQPQSTAAIAEGLRLPCKVVVDSVAALAEADLLDTTNDDGAGWSLNLDSEWMTGVRTLALVYDSDRRVALNLLRFAALQRERACALRRQLAGRVR